MGKTKKIVSSTTSNLILKFRVDIQSGHDIEYTIDCIKEYIDWRQLEVVQSTCGKHIDSKTPHFHYHAEVKPPSKIYSSENYVFRKVYLVKQAQSQEREHEALSIYWSKQRFGIQIDPVKITDLSGNDNADAVSKALQDVLAYPLKEKSPIEYGCVNADVPQLTLIGNAEWEFSKKKKRQREEKEQQDKMKWSRIIAHLNEKKPKSEYQAFTMLLDYLRNESPTPDPHRIRKMAFNYCYYARILSNDEITKAVYGHINIKSETEKNAEAIAKFLHNHPEPEVSDNDSDDENIKLVINESPYGKIHPCGFNIFK